MADLAARLRAWVGDGRGTVLLTDFDGTLAPIVDDPASARPLPGTGGVLAGLAERLDVVAVVSGRPVAYLADRLPDVGHVRLVGLYGLERVVDGQVEESVEARRWRPVVAAVADRAEAAAPEGVHVERKGSTVVLHVRRSPRHAGWVEDFARSQAAATGLAAHPGKLSVELRPPDGGDKGTVVDELGAGAAAVAFLGDDVGDLPAFAALARLRSAGVRTLAVAVGGAEAPAAVLAAVDVVVDGPADALAGLRSLLD